MPLATKTANAGTSLLWRPQPRATRRTASLKSIDLFCGAGGLSLGLSHAGFEPAMAIECDEDAAQTYSAAFPKVKVLQQRIESLDFRPYRGIDLIAGGPPCQPFSSGGKRLAEQDLRDMVPEFIRAVEAARPRAFLMENVAGLFGSTHSAYFQGILHQFRGLGYAIATPRVLNAADYGVPQKRKRGFLVGVREGEFFEFPEPTHGPGRASPHVPVCSVLNPRTPIGVPNSSKVFYARNPDLRPSPYDGHLFNGGGRPIDLGSPCHTILASAGGNKTHFFDVLGRVPEYHQHLAKGGAPRRGCLEGARRLTVAESALIQTFPPELVFHGCRSRQYTQVGNAVPPLLAKAIGLKLIELLA